MARGRRALGATRAASGAALRPALRDLRDTRAWDAFADKWRETLPRMRADSTDNGSRSGSRTTRTGCAPELVALLQSIDSPFVGACVDFGNNLALLEDPDETIELLTPYAITTHLKDMARAANRVGFELSEVPLGRDSSRSNATSTAAQGEAPTCHCASR